MRKIYLILIIFCISTNTHSQIVEGVTTRVVMDQVSESLTQIVNDAMSRFDYSVAKAAMEGLTLIQAWKEANSDLLDKAFTGIDTQSRNVISRIEGIVH